MLVLSASAKINWLLYVLHKRDDGYHAIMSLMQCVTLEDSLTMERADTVEVVTGAPIPCHDNLVYKAIRLVQDRTGVSEGVRITLTKQIPMAAGLGGGSSDAASTLKGLNSLWGLGLTHGELVGFGEKLGSDVPFFFDGPAAVIEGRGERVSPVRLSRPYVIVLVKPPVDVSTAWAYAQLDAVSGRSVLTKERNNIKLFCHALETGDFSLLSSLQRNDLEPSVLKRYPVVGEIKRMLAIQGALFSAMSGSGSAVFGLFRTEEEAVKAREALSPHWCRVVRTITDDERD